MKWQPPTFRIHQESSRVTSKKTYAINGKWPEATYPNQQRVQSYQDDNDRSGVPCYWSRSQSPFEFEPNFSCQSVNRRKNGEIIYNVKVSSNEFGYRKTGLSRGPKKGRHVLVMGCSYAFGEGLEDDETLSARISENSQDSEGYNFGNPGGSVNEQIYKIEQGVYYKGVTQNEGTAIYLLIEDHIFRSVGMWSRAWSKSLINIEETSMGSFNSRGRFQDSFFYYSRIRDFVMNLSITKVFNLDFPIITTGDYEQYARKIKFVEQEYKKQTSINNRLIVVFYPDGYFSQRSRDAFISAFEKYKVNYLDYHPNRIEGSIRGLSFIPFDGHPSASAMDFFSKRLTQDLAL